MKRFLLLLALGLITVNVTNGCKPAETTTTPTPATTDTNATTTNAVPPPAH
jgi:hypothetical protein